MRLIGSMAILLAALAAGCSDDTGRSESALTSEQAGGNSACAACCKALFPPGADRGHCISEAAHGRGPCICAGQCCVPDLSVPPPPADLSQSSDGGGAIP